MAPGCYAAGSHLTAVMGENNYNYYLGSYYLTPEQGTEWAQTVVSLLSSVAYQGWSGNVAVWGGIDAEMHWNSGEATLDWALAFSEVKPTEWYLDFGTCEDCGVTTPPCTSPGHPLVSTPYPWTCQQRYDVAQGEPANPTSSRAMPEIYDENGYNAQEWYNLSLFGHDTYTRSTPHDPYIDGAIGFRGALTQWNACEEDEGTQNQCPTGIANGTDNDPAMGFQQLNTQLWSNADTVPLDDPYPFMVWSSDMSWEK